MITLLGDIRLLCLSSLCFLSLTAAFGQAPQRIPGYPKPMDGEVRAVAIDTQNERMYIGGNFTKLRSGRDFSALLNANDKTSVEDFPSFDGTVYVSESDQNGGLFIGGSFSSVGNFSRKGLVHINAEGNVTAFKAEIDGAVKALLFDGEQLFVGGDFKTVNGEERLNTCCLKFPTSELTDFAPKVQGSVNAFEEKGDNIFIGGKFDHIGYSSKDIFVIDAQTQEPVEDIVPEVANHDVRSAISDGNGGWFITGFFTTVGDSARNRLAHIDEFGNPTSWKCSGAYDGSFVKLARHEDALYIGGQFTTIGGQTRNGAAKLSTTTGEVLPWDPQLEPGTMTPVVPAFVNSFAFRDSSVYLGGRFKANGVKHLAKVDEETGEVDTSVNLFISGDQVRSIYFHGSHLYYTGYFSGTRGTERNGSAMVDFETGELSSFELAQSNDSQRRINDLFILGDTMYLGGSFSLDSDVGSTGIAALLLPDYEEIEIGIESSTVFSMAASKTDIYINNFSFKRGSLEINPLSVSNIYSIIYSLASDTINDRVIYCGRSRDYLTLAKNDQVNLALFTKEGEKLDFDPLPQNVSFPSTELFEGAISDLLLVNDSILFVSGGFEQSLENNESNYLIAISLNTGMYTESPTPNGPVTTMVRRGNNLIIGGEFSEVDGEIRSNMARWNTETKQLLSSPVAFNNVVRRIVSTETEWLVCGDFSEVNGIEERNIAILDKMTLEPIAIPRNPKKTVNDINILNGQYFVGGSFLGFGPTLDRINFAVIDLKTKEVLDYAPNPNDAVRDILLDDDRVVVAGDFNFFDGDSSEAVVFLDRNTSNQVEWGPDNFDINGSVFDLENDDENLYIIGNYFSGLNPTQPGIIAIHKSDQTMLDWPSQPFTDFASSADRFFTCHSDDGSVYIGGNFNVTINGEERKKIFEVDQVTGQITDFTLDLLGDYCTSEGFTEKPKIRAIYGIAAENDDFLTVVGDLRIDPCIDIVTPYDMTSGSSFLDNDSFFDIKGILRVDRSSGEVGDYGTGIPGNYRMADESIGSSADFIETTGRAVGINNSKIYFGGEGWLTEINSENDALTDWAGSGPDWGEIERYRNINFFPQYDWSKIYAVYTIDIADNIMAIGGDFELMNGNPASRLAVYKIDCGVSGGSVSTESTTRNICLNDQTDNPIVISLEEAEGSDAQVLIDLNNNIIDYSLNGTINMDDYEPGIYFLGNIAFDGINTDATNLSELKGCYDLSNFIAVTTFRADGGSIQAGSETNLCIDDVDKTVQLSVSGATGINTNWVLVSSDFSEVLETNISGLFDFDQYESGTYKVVHISTADQVSVDDLTLGNLPDCFDKSNIIKITVNACASGLMTVSPNPARETSTVSFELTQEGNALLELYDINGRLIDEIRSGIAPAKVEQRYQTNVGHLPQGVYIYRLTTDNETETVKFLKN